MLKKISNNLLITAVLCGLMCNGAYAHSSHKHADRGQHKRPIKPSREGHGAPTEFPVGTIMKFLLSQGHIKSTDDFNGYHDQGHGRVSVYCSETVNGKILTAKKKFDFVLLNTSAGEKWLFVSVNYDERAIID